MSTLFSIFWLPYDSTEIEEKLTVLPKNKIKVLITSLFFVTLSLKKRALTLLEQNYFEDTTIFAAMVNFVLILLNKYT